ncbi:hypothetical protein Dimus_036326 [Dionaea muscipula]
MDAVNEFYAKLIMSHNRKKDVAKSKESKISGDEAISEVCPLLGDEECGSSFGKRDTTSYMDLIYMDHSIAGRLVNFPRAMMRHMSYVISVKDHELPYGDWLTIVFEKFGVPLVDKKGEELKKYDFFEETFLTMCKLIRENRVWWIGTRENRRRDDDDEVPEEEDEEEEKDQTEFDWEAVIDEAAEQGESGSDDQFFYAQVEVEEPMDETPRTPAVPKTIHSSTVR